MTRARRMILATAATLVALVFVGVAIALLAPAPPRPFPNVGADNVAAEIGGPFKMVDDEGRAVTQADFADKPTVMFFGFTHCPDVCPTTLMELAGLMQKLGPDADKLHYVFVSVDPERDTPEVLHEYTSAFDPRFQALSGTADDLKQMAREYRVLYRKVPTDGGYTMDHTATVYLMDRDNNLVSTIDPHDSDESKLDKLKGLIDKA